MKSDNKNTSENELSLDPADWNEFSKQCHKSLDDLIAYQKTVRSRPVWSTLPRESKSLFKENLPRKSMPLKKVYDQVKKHILPYPTNNIHPRFWSWVGGTGTATQLLADMVISSMNSASLGMDEASSSYVELQLLDWLKEMLDYPKSASGLLVSGGSMANLVGLAVARTEAANYNVRDEGINTNNQPRLIFYTSTETHSSIKKAIELLGIGAQSLRLINANDDYTININSLKKNIELDRLNGNKPACIIANVGTVNTGAIDPLLELASISKKNNIWLHADGAFGALVKLSESSKDLVNGLEKADSIAFDLHKWMYVQYDCGCVLIKGDKPHKETFSVIPHYIKKFEKGLASGPLNFSEYGVELSRSFRALRPWMALKTEGSNRYGKQIEQNIQQAKYLTNLIQKESNLQLLAPTSLNIVNFRYLAPKIDNKNLNQLNTQILMGLHESGVAAPSSALLNKNFSIRVAICNHRSKKEDFDLLIDKIIEIGNNLST